MKYFFAFLSIIFTTKCFAQYAPSAGQIGTTAIHKDSSIIINWATKVTSFNPGFENIAISGALASFGDSTKALNQAEGNSTDIVSLGDNGSITLAFEYPIKNGVGHDFTVFENSFSHDFLELAFVEVSTDGIRFVRFPSVSLTDNAQEIGSFGTIDATKIYNLAGKYKQSFGTPFNLNDLIDSTGINLDSINYVRIIDVVGTINPLYATYDSHSNIIIDPYPTAFNSGGFDLDAIGVINENNIFASYTSYTQFIAFSIYPNPAQNTVFISTNTNTEYSILLFDNLGREIYSGRNKSVINTSALVNGTYYITIRSKSNVSFQKLIIQK